MVATLDDVLSTLNRILRIQMAEYNYDQTRYLASKVRAGQAVVNKGVFFQSIAPGGNFSLVIPNPPGYVQIGHGLWFRTSQSGVIELTLAIDNVTIPPWLYAPVVFDIDLVVQEILPYNMVVNNQASYVAINHDASAQWFAAFYVSTLLRKDVWQADLAEMNQLAQQFGLTGVSLTPPAS